MKVFHMDYPECGTELYCLLSDKVAVPQKFKTVKLRVILRATTCEIKI